MLKQPAVPRRFQAMRLTRALCLHIAEDVEESEPYFLPPCDHALIEHLAEHLVHSTEHGRPLGVADPCLAHRIADAGLAYVVRVQGLSLHLPQGIILGRGPM